MRTFASRSLAAFVVLLAALPPGWSGPGGRVSAADDEVAGQGDPVRFTDEDKKTFARHWTADEKFLIVAPLLAGVQESREKIGAARAEVDEADAGVAGKERDLRTTEGLAADDDNAKAEKERKLTTLREELDALRKKSDEARKRVVAIEVQLDQTFEKAAETGNAKRAADKSLENRHRLSKDHVREWVILGTNLGKAGLVTAAAPDPRDFAEAFQGTWELESRFSHGRKTDTTAQIFYDLDATTGGGQVMVMEGGTLHAFVGTSGGDDAAFSIAARFDIDSKIEPPRLQGVDGDNIGRIQAVRTVNTGDLFGSYQAFRAGIRGGSQPASFLKLGDSYTVFGDVLAPSGRGSDEFVRIETNGDTMTYVSPNTDTIDTYRRISKKRPLVNGIWPLKTFFRMATDPASAPPAAKDAAFRLEAQGVKGVAPHFFLVPPPRR